MVDEAVKEEKPGKSRCKRSWAWRSMPAWPTFGKPSQEHDESKDGLGYIVRFFFIFVGF